LKNPSPKQPIVLREWEVRAILEERKTQLQRPIKPQPPEYCDYFEIRGDVPNRFRGYMQPGEPTELLLPKCPYGIPGDLLWVREAFCYGWDIHAVCFAPELLPEDILYKADIETKEKVPWRSAVTMPRKSSRIWLRINEIRVEKIPNIPVPWHWTIECERLVP